MSAGETPGADRAFARRVLAIVRALHPGKRLALSPEGDAIRIGDIQFGLDNLAARFRLAGGDDARLETMVREHFELLAHDAGELTGELSWGEAKPLLLPQIMPESFLKQIQLVNRPFAPGLRMGLVVDAPKGYRYARADELTAWRVTLPQALATALANLDARSQSLQIHAVLDRDKFLAVQSGDGYDAARVLLPRWLELAGSHLGLPFRFGIPNRDFLICWSADTRPETQTSFRTRIAEDFGRQPYPLSPLAFEMNSEGNVRPLE